MKIQNLEVPSDARMIVISDIHANLDYFEALLKKIEFSENDVLIIDGDFLEKGERSLDTMHFIMDLVRRGNTYVVYGNCDSWDDVIDRILNEPDKMSWIIRYMKMRESGLLFEMFREMNVDVSDTSDLEKNVSEMCRRYRDEFDFLRSLPTAIETPHYTFVHGGIRPDLPLKEQRQGECIKMDNFRGRGWSFDKWVIVGHWPVMLYIYDHVSAMPIIDRDRKIISIDGGCVLKDDGQLNALIIPYEGSEDFQCEWYDPFPVRIAAEHQSASEVSYYIRWGDSEVEVIHPGEEFSLCRHVRTGYQMEILTKYLSEGEDGRIHTNDCSDYRLEVNPGDPLSVIETTSRGYYVKSQGVSGWYYGRMEQE